MTANGKKNNTDSKHIEVVVPISLSTDIIKARQSARDVAKALGFDLVDQALVAAAVSDLARNVLQHAGKGQVWFRPDSAGLLMIEVRGCSPDESQLAVARKAADSFDVVVQPGIGTVVSMTKFRPGAVWLCV
jgi:serine/threonine-protein kinase RsbT